MSTETINFATGIEFLEAGPLEKNPMLSKVKIKIAYPGNANGFYISKEELEKAGKRSLGLVPIVGYFNNYTNDFGEHGSQPVFDEFGNLVTIGKAESLGVIPENPKIYWEGIYLVTEGYLWTGRYPEIIEATKGRPQSLEFNIEHTKVSKGVGGYNEITDAVFSALCILGKDVPPAFTGASIEGISFSLKEDSKETEFEKGMKKFMADLEFALREEEIDSQTAPFIVDEEGVEKNKETREMITEAIDSLEDVALIEEESQDVIDDSITKLVQAETDLAGEAKITPRDTDVVEELNGEPSNEEGLVTSESISYKSSASMIRKNKDKEERDEEARKEETETSASEAPTEQTVAPEPAPAIPVKEEVEEPTPATEETKEVADEEVDTVGGNEGENPIPTGVASPTEGAPGEGEDGVQEDPKRNPFIEPASTPIEEGVGTEATIQEEPKVEVPKRKTADDKRKEAVLDSISDKELSDHLVERVREAEEIKETIAGLTGSTKEDVQVESSEEAETEEESAEMGEEEVVTGEEVAETEEETAETTETQEETVEVDEKEEVTAPTEKAEEAKPDEEEDAEEPEVDEEEDEKETEEEDDKKKKKPEFSLDFRAIVEENVALRKENETLKEQTELLLEFKLKADIAEKKALLDTFAISKTAKDSILSDSIEFSKSLEEVEKEAALAFYKEMNGTGQKETGNSIQFSIQNEAEKIDGLAAILEQASKA